jgi:hypothetical protein
MILPPFAIDATLIKLSEPWRSRIGGFFWRASQKFSGRSKMSCSRNQKTKKLLKLSVLAALPFFLFTFSSGASVLEKPQAGQVNIEAEIQRLWQGRNDAAIPGDNGTRFSLKEAIPSPRTGFRIEAGYNLSDKHQLRGVFAPLALQDSGTLARPVTFLNTTFNSASPVEAIYQFNSYRLTYRYLILDDEKWTIFLGFTGKIRNATIALRQGTSYEEKKNLGFVPLLHAAAVYRLMDTWQAELEVDALAAPQGRAEDLRLALRKNLSTPGLSVALGYRVLEGGADNKEVFTFSLFHYLLASVGYRF